MCNANQMPLLDDFKNCAVEYKPWFFLVCNKTIDLISESVLMNNLILLSMHTVLSFKSHT